MSHSLTTKYQVRLFILGFAATPVSWNCKRDGRPTEASLRRYVESFEASTQPGGVNAHLGPQQVLSATVRLNEWAGKVVAEYKREKTGGAMFQTVTEYNI